MLCFALVLLFYRFIKVDESNRYSWLGPSISLFIHSQVIPEPSMMLSSICQLFFLAVQLAPLCFVSGFAPYLPLCTSTRSFKPSETSLRYDNFQRELEENSRRKAKGGTGETLAGALLGGLLMGPFGAFFGAQIGSGLGANNALDRAKKEEMKRLGITQEMLDTAQDCGLALERSREGLKATQDSLATQQSYARMLDKECEELYEKAKASLEAGNEEKAKEFLFNRSETQEKLKIALKQCAEAKQRLEKMEDNVKAIERRAKEVEAMMTRIISSKASQDLDTDFSLPPEDPLLQKFKDAGID